MILPWRSFPSQMPALRDLVAQMTNQDRRSRPRAAVALKHQWFSSASDAALPQDIKQMLVHGCEQSQLAELVNLDLVEANNLDEIRALADQLRAKGPGGTLEVAAFEELLCAHHVDNAIAERFVQKVKNAEGRCPYEEFVRNVIADKEAYSVQYVRECFNDIDLDEDGYLDEDELINMLKSSTFECEYDDVHAILEDMDTNDDGLISWDEFKRAVLEDGRIARRADHAHNWGERSHSFWDILGCRSE